MAKQTKASESAETKVEETPVVETPVEGASVEETTERTERTETVETVETVKEADGAEVPAGEDVVETGTEEQEGQESDRLVDDAYRSHAEGVAEEVTTMNVAVEGQEHDVETYTTVASVAVPDKEEEIEPENEKCPYTLNLAVPTVIYRGPHQSLGEKRFCGVVTVLTAADANGFAQVEFVRPGVGLTKGYIIL